MTVTTAHRSPSGPNPSSDRGCTTHLDDMWWQEVVAMEFGGGYELRLETPFTVRIDDLEREIEPGRDSDAPAFRTTVRTRRVARGRARLRRPTDRVLRRRTAAGRAGQQLRSVDRAASKSTAARGELSIWSPRDSWPTAITAGRSRDHSCIRDRGGGAAARLIRRALPLDFAAGRLHALMRSQAVRDLPRSLSRYRVSSGVTAVTARSVPSPVEVAPGARARR